ncbi:MAG TPA: zinc-dependent alcohol dehydrogenase family protein [Gammaproteobacteria bacterium]|nr:zinc-dependent alcohol dehydrogenase family protein [Gammaproteobacteria bacterium]
MKAMIISDFGEPDVLQAADLPVPELRPGHVLIRTAATSVNPVDCLIRGMGPAFAPTPPAVLHGDVAGVVEAVADDVSAFRPGDEVFGCAGGVAGTEGALAELMLADADLLARKPSSLAMREAAALPLVTITAWEGLFQRARVGAGSRLLIHGGAGGVGHIAVQLAKAAGAEVTATVSTDAKAELAQSLGADEVVRYREEGVTDYVERLTGGEGFDVVFDTAGGANLPNALAAARPHGEVVTTVALGEHDLTPAHLAGLSLHVIFMLLPLIRGKGRRGHGDILARAARLADQGWLRPVLDSSRLRADQAARAHERLEAGAASGKIVLTWD